MDGKRDKGRAHWRGLSCKRGAAGHTWRYTATVTQTPAERQCGEWTPDFSSLPPSSQGICWQPPRTQWGPENGSSRTVVSSRTCCDLTQTYFSPWNHRARALHTQPSIPPFWCFCPFLHLGRKGWTTSQVRFQEVLSAVHCVFLGTALAVRVSDVAPAHKPTEDLWKWGSAPGGLCNSLFSFCTWRSCS